MAVIEWPKVSNTTLSTPNAHKFGLTHSTTVYYCTGLIQMAAYTFLLEHAWAVRACLGGVGVALLAGPMGCLLVWRRMAFFTDALGHSTLLGIGLGIVFHLSPRVSALLGMVLLIVPLFFLKRTTPQTDALLGGMSHAYLAFGLLLIHLLPGVNINIHALLFGDILSTTLKDLAWIYGVGLLIFVGLGFFWSALVSMSVNEDMAKIEGIATAWVEGVFFVLVGLLVAIALQVVGVLLTAALLILPALCSTRIGKTPEQTAVLASSIGIACTLGGIALAFWWDVPVGPSIAATMAFIFCAILLIEFLAFKKQAPPP